MKRAAPVALGLVALGLVTVTSGACGSGSGADPKVALSRAGETWCPEGFEAGPSDTCFAIPEHPTKETPVLVYLHGMYQGHGSPEEWTAVSVAAKRGFAVVIPRGRRGLCAWRAEFKDHYCWPQDPEDTEAMKTVVAGWDRVLWQVDALLEGGTHRRYVLGSSNGAFFATYLATHQIFRGQGYAVVNGGGDPGPALMGAGRHAPMLLIAGQDAMEEAPKMNRLNDALIKASWPHAFCPRPGGVALTSSDVDAAIRFFKQDAEGTLKAGPTGLYPCDGAAPTASPAPAPR